MNTIVIEKMMPFKELEKKVFDYICEMGRIMIKVILENYDEHYCNPKDDVIQGVREKSF